MDGGAPAPAAAAAAPQHQDLCLIVTETDGGELHPVWEEGGRG